MTEHDAHRHALEVIADQRLPEGTKAWRWARFVLSGPQCWWCHGRGPAAAGAWHPCECDDGWEGVEEWAGLDDGWEPAWRLRGEG